MNHKRNAIYYDNLCNNSGRVAAGGLLFGQTDAVMSGEGGLNVPLQTDESSKCSATGVLRRTLPADIRHPASNPPFSDLVSENSWYFSRTLRTSNLSSVVTLNQFHRAYMLCAGRIYNRKYQSSIFCLSKSCGKNIVDSGNLVENSRCGGFRTPVGDFRKPPHLRPASQISKAAI